MNARGDQSEPLGESLDTDTVAAIGRAAELGMLAGRDLVTAKRDAGVLTLPVVGLSADLVRGLIRERIADIVAVIDDHDPGVYEGVEYSCPGRCKFRGAQAEWERHLADKLADALVGE